MNDAKTPHMDWEEFRQLAREVVDMIVDYHRNVASYPVLSRNRPGQVRDQLPLQAPWEGESFERIFRDVERIILPGLTHWQSPSFFGFFPANVSAPSILGEMLCAGLGVQGMMWATSPACTELETHVLDWLVDMLALPEAFSSKSTGGGVIQDSASSATLCALLAAREQATGLHSDRFGCQGNLTAYASDQAHSSVEKAVRVAGLGKDNLRRIEVDSSVAMRPDLLERAVERDLREGKTPCFVCATLGTTSSLAFDDLGAIGEICSRYSLWLHVDAALAGAASICPELRSFQEGLELAQSYCFNPHKWLLTNFDCDCFYVQQREPLLQALSILPEYLRNQASESGEVFDYRDWQIPLGRRFRALKLWFVLRSYGIEGLQRHIRNHVALAREFASWIDESMELELLAPTRLNLVCFAHRNGDAFSRRLLDDLNESGALYLTHTVLGDRFALRFCVGQTFTERRHVQSAFEHIRETARRLDVGRLS